MLLPCLLMMSGCGLGTGAVTDPPPVAVVTDTTSIRCPEPDPRHLAVLRRRVSPPHPDQPEGVSRARLYAKIDELRRDADSKGRTGLALASELQRCRGVIDADDNRAS